MNIDDIIICISIRTKTTAYNLSVGDRYQVISTFAIDLVDVINIKTGKTHYWIPTQLFDKVDAFRDSKIEDILK